jgi:hypothetical protein|tara:strand:+ start:184 stop:498 length:315 start_codon:yes stop_codon:yes gene_type:complete
MDKNPKINLDFVASENRGRTNPSTVVQLITTKGAEKLPAQAQKIVECLVKAKNHKLTVREIVGEDEAGLNSALDAVGLVTEQTPNRIWTYYKNRLAKEGFITLS